MCVWLLRELLWFLPVSLGAATITPEDAGSLPLCVWQLQLDFGSPLGAPTTTLKALPVGDLYQI